MNTTVKKYPRAKVSRHATLDGWVIDLIIRENAKPKRVNATYASIPWARRAAQIKLGVKVDPMPGKDSAPAAQPDRTPRLTPELVAAITPPAPRPTPVTADAGACGKCQRPMRPAGSKAADHPGTVLRQRAGLCQSCYQATR
ncbi:hypothetical protein PBI_BRIDGETTE_56 [Arthrobacter phage Bridgette]|uniref:Uncharacterized protein n=1 Tax=Arthrobacter phage Bridgette TaxID=2419949 RepID=A0A3G2KE94_9CAUD|nr:hypothetical protein HOU46_gp56 [Arthrobacter phage Bridgette]AYN57322.1 hypothetical protein PBI_BRIDGETTE_56 [Arthrobacter phage Bridgette]